MAESDPYIHALPGDAGRPPGAPDTQRSVQRRLDELQTKHAALLEEHQRLRDELADSRQLQGELGDALQVLAQRERELSSRHRSICEENSRLMLHSIASQRLLEAQQPADLVLAVREIIANMIGSEELGIYECTPDGSWLHQIGSFGLDDAHWKDLPAEGWLAQSLAEQRVLVADDADDAEDAGRAVCGKRLSACVPLVAGDATLGIVAIFDLLPHKQALTAADEEVLSLLSHHGGLALRLCTLNLASLERGD